MSAVTFLAGMSVGACVGVVIAGLLRSASDADRAQPQLPLLGRGTWLVGIDEHNEMTRCEPHTCFETSVQRLLDEA